MRITSALLLVLLTAPLSPAHEALAQSDSTFERRLLQDLRAVNPAAADTFARANAAREAEHHAEAAAEYSRTRTMVPAFAPAWRREGYELLALELRTDAIERMRSALALQDSSWNMLGLATALVALDKPSQAEMDEAVRLIRRAETQAENPSLSVMACQLAIRTDDVAWFRVEVERFLRVAPQHPLAHMFSAVQLSSDGKVLDAVRELKVARALGLPEPLYRRVEKGIIPASYRIAGIGGIILGAWIAGLVVLLVLGMVLSAATLRASGRLPPTASGTATGFDAILRRTYGGLLGVSCAYYFFSLPIVVGCVLVAGGGLVYVLMSSGVIPVKLVLIIAVLTLITIWAVLKSVFVRVRDEDPGVRLDMSDYPRLRALLDEVAAKIETRPVSNVYVTPGTDLAVMERGGMFRQIRGNTERCLILGLGVIEGMKLGPFRAILAHEYGHFSNRDTAGGGLALAVRRSLVLTAVHLARGGAAAWYNPAWLFVNGFYRIFLRISQGASRLQEVLADRWAAFSYGSQAFAAGLRHVIVRSTRFGAHVDSVVNEVMQGNRPLANLYSFRPVAAPAEETLAAAVEQAMTAAPSPYDSHPRPVDRIAWCEALSTEAQPHGDDETEVWSLFDGREALEERMTDVVRRNIDQHHGILLPRDEAQLAEWKKARAAGSDADAEAASAAEEVHR